MSDENDAELADAILARAMRDKATRKVAFDELADQLSESLENLSGDSDQVTAAHALAKEGRALAARFRSWTDTPPTDAERNDTIDGIAKFNQQALRALSAETRSGSQD